jgi:NADH dehydrogenase (ubiquinone) 1 beta subcomplex subunit 7
MYLQEQMHDANIDMVYRDFCAHLLIPLNECRRKSFYLPWKCEHERHEYELCQYKEYKRRDTSWYDLLFYKIYSIKLF